MREKACLWKCQGWSARRREVRGRQAGKRPAGPQASPQPPPPPRGPALRPVQRAQGSGPHSAGLLGPHLPAAPLPAPFKLGRGPKGRRLGPPFRTGVAAKQPGAWPAPGRGEAPAPGGREAAGPHSRAPCPPQARLRAQPGGAAPSAQSPRPAADKRKSRRTPACCDSVPHRSLQRKRLLQRTGTRWRRSISILLKHKVSQWSV